MTSGCWLIPAFCLLGHSDDEDSTIQYPVVPISPEFTVKDRSSQFDTAGSDSAPCFSIACDSCVVGTADDTMVDMFGRAIGNKVEDQPPLQFITISSGSGDHLRKKVRNVVPTDDYSSGDLANLRIEPLSHADREAMRKLLVTVPDIKPFVIEPKNRCNVEAPKPINTLKMVELYKDPVTGQRKAKVHKLDEEAERKLPLRRRLGLRRLLRIPTRGGSKK
jgi:hypothetical protein